MISIMKPLLPSAQEILPHLERVDESRWYSNTGPLTQEYEERLSKLYNCHVVSCSSATSGLTASLMAALPFDYHTRAMVGMPSWSFAATASAIFSAGFRPLICDVDSDDIINVSGAGGCKAFVVVAPLGKPANNWDAFAEYYNTPVVIDAASGFDSYQSVKIGNVPVVISTHCTKAFGTGEGGFVLSQDKELIEKIRRICNQGMLPDKSVSELGINAKLSEYHAAVGLAELDGWEEKRKRWMEIQDWYGDTKPYANSTHSVLLDTPAAPIVARLAEKGIQARASWYGTCHKQDVFTKVWGGQQMGTSGKIHMPMTRTNMLAERMIFLPKYIGMTRRDVRHIVRSLEECV